MKKYFKPGSWHFSIPLIAGVIIGLFSYTAYISNSISYLSDEPETCINCHIMVPQYSTWKHSSHREVANCNDCHVPHNNVVNKYYFKAKDGLRHASVFTMRNEPQVIFIKEEGADVVHQNCIRCHTDQINHPKLVADVQNHQAHMEDRKCWDCHREVPHGRVNSLSSSPNAIAPVLDSPVPDWLKEMTN